jgi:hypothetical protein
MDGSTGTAMPSHGANRGSNPRGDATHFLMKTLPRVAGDKALRVLAYNLTRVMNNMGPCRLIAAMHT